jgi:hypothetical protein
MDLKNHPLNNCVIKSSGVLHGAEIMDFWRSQGINSSMEGTSAVSPYYGIVDGGFGNWDKPLLPDDVNIFETVEQVREFTKYGGRNEESDTQEKKKYQTINRVAVEKIYVACCHSWKERIEALLSKNLFKTEIKVPEEMLEEAFEIADKTQTALLLEYFNKPEKIFTAGKLKPGEMMKITDSKQTNRIGMHLLRTFDQLIIIEDPIQTWHNPWSVEIKGEKIASGTEFKIKAK